MQSQNAFFAGLYLNKHTDLLAFGKRAMVGLPHRCLKGGLDHNQVSLGKTCSGTNLVDREAGMQGSSSLLRRG